MFIDRSAVRGKENRGMTERENGRLVVCLLHNLSSFYPNTHTHEKLMLRLSFAEHTHGTSGEWLFEVTHTLMSSSVRRFIVRWREGLEAVNPCQSHTPTV